MLPVAFLERLSLERRTRYWQDWLREGRPRHQLAVALREARIVGFVATGPSRDPDADDTTGEIYAIYLEPGVVGTGVGRALGRHAVDHLARVGFVGATLWVMATNGRARRFYERGGWHADGIDKTDDWAGTAVRVVRYRRSLIGPVRPPDRAAS